MDIYKISGRTRFYNAEVDVIMIFVGPSLQRPSNRYFLTQPQNLRPDLGGIC